MTSSNKTSRSSRINTYIAILVSIVAIAGMSILFIEVRTLDAKFSAQSAIFEQVNAEISSKEKQISTLSDEIEGKNRSLDDLLRDIQDATIDVREVEELERRAQEAEARAAAAKQREDDATHGKELLDNRISNLEGETSRLNTEIGDLRANVTSLSGERDILDPQVAKLTASRNTLGIEIDQREDRRDFLDAEILSLEDKQNILSGEIVSLKRNKEEVRRLKEEEAALLARLAQINNNITGQSTQLAVSLEQATAAAKNIDGLRIELVGLEASKSTLLGSLDPLKDEHASVLSDVESAKTTLGETQNEIYEANVKIAALNGNLLEVSSDLIRRTSELGELKRHVREAEASRSGVQAEVDAKAARISELIAQIAQLEQQQATVNAAITNRSVARDQLVAQVSELSAEKQSFSIEIETLSDSKESLVATLSVKEATLNELERKIASFEQEIADLEALTGEKSSSISTVIQELAQTRAKLETTNEKLLLTRSQRDSLLGEIDQLVGQKRALEKILSDLQASIEANASDDEEPPILEESEILSTQDQTTEGAE